jgi:hypothetical protein
MFEPAVLNKADSAHDPKVVTNHMSVIVGHFNPGPPPRGAGNDGEAIDTIPALHMLESTGASESAVRQQLARILRSPIFVHSEKLSRFLQFIVEHLISGNQRNLKEYLIGSEVYDRRPPYHPNQDSIVRTEARRLRGKLKEYYETEGKDDPIYVYLRPGSYIPILQYKEALIGSSKAAETYELSLSARRQQVSYLNGRIAQLELLVVELLVKNQQQRFSLDQMVCCGAAEKLDAETKQPFAIALKSNEPHSFARLWEMEGSGCRHRS